MTVEQSRPAADIHQLLAQGGNGRRRRVWWLLALILLLAGGVAAYLLDARQPVLPTYQTTPVQRGGFAVIVTATGTLQPVNQVEVGTESSGTVRTVTVNHNDTVKAGQILAQLDTAQLNARLRQSQAALETARATVAEAETTLTESRNKLARAREMQKRNLCSQEECDAAQATYDRAQATLHRAEAQVKQAQAQVDADLTALGKAVIRSPIDGIVLKREIEPGQTVAASFQTPVLFLLAENLTQMELKVAVDEADVGKVQQGQPATFTVDAYPEREFPAAISQVRYAPETVEGVVTYETVLAVDNSDLSLRPGMTATASISVQQVTDALLVPNTALRFTPPASNAEAGSGGTLISQLLPGPPRRPNNRSAKANADSRERQVWVLRDGVPVAIPVTIGSSNGVLTEISGGELQAGQEVITASMSTGR